MMVDTIKIDGVEKAVIKTNLDGVYNLKNLKDYMEEVARKIEEGE